MASIFRCRKTTNDRHTETTATTNAKTVDISRVALAVAFHRLLHYYSETDDLKSDLMTGLMTGEFEMARGAVVAIAYIIVNVRMRRNFANGSDI